MKIEALVKADDLTFNIKESNPDLVMDETLYSFLKQWVNYGDYIKLEFDMKRNTCKVIKV